LECGFAVLEKTPIVAQEDVNVLRQVPLSTAFTQYSQEDLLASNGFFLLKAATVEHSGNQR
jgi:hypothetical protein